MPPLAPADPATEDGSRGGDAEATAPSHGPSGFLPGADSPHLVSGAGFVGLLCALTVALAIAIAVAIGIGIVAVPVDDVLAVLWSHLAGDTRKLDPLTNQIVWDFRTPSVLLAP